MIFRKVMIKITKCEVCENEKLNKVLDLGKHPLCDDLISIDNNTTCEEYPIEILFCEECLTAHQSYQIPKQTLFTNSYHYRARMTGSVLSGMADFVEGCENRFGSLHGKVVLDIGCNDGSLLDFFKIKGCKTVGIEPTGAALESKHPTINEYFDNRSAYQVLSLAGKPDLIVFTNVFAHIEDLPSLINNLKILSYENTKLVIENHYLGAVFNGGQFDTFYHEHPRTYSFRSFEFIAKSLEMNVLDAEFVSRYGGNIRVYLGVGDKKHLDIDESQFSSAFVKMSTDMLKWKTETKVMIDDLVRKNGLMRAKAFPGRAAILIKLLGLNENHISAVYEIKGSIKVGHYVPGTRIPILPEIVLYAKKDLKKPIINLAWHLPSEVRANLFTNGYTGNVIDIKAF
jgi:SAM-dependent methyltransferase